MTSTEVRKEREPFNDEPGYYYQLELDMDSRTAPEVLRINSPDLVEDFEVPISRFTTREFHEIEKEKVWPKTWQWACREEEIPEPGDTHVYEIAGTSILLVRQPDRSIKAYPNSCLHRGRQLRSYNGRTPDLRCPFHGICWNLDGSMKHMPFPWDFPNYNAEEWRLPEFKVDTWGGFVWVNQDPKCEPLADALGVIPEHFKDWHLEDRYMVANVSKVMRCNWKVAMDAFVEAMHVVATHPQQLNAFGCVTSQYDVIGNTSRTLSAIMGSSMPLLRQNPTEQEKWDSMMHPYLYKGDLPKIPEGVTARRFAADAVRNSLRDILGPEADHKSDAEVLDLIYYTAFPNSEIWGGLGSRWQYRWRPYDDRHDMCVMDMVFLAPFKGERPPPAENHFLGPDEPWTEAEELGMFGRFENQDAFNLEAQQRGLESSVEKTLRMSRYQESRIRHFHRMLNDYIDRG